MRDKKAHKCACTIERRIASLLPGRYRQASLEDFHADILDAIVRWIHRPTDGLFITGTVGTGKTHLAAAIVRRLAESNIDTTFKRCAQFYEDVRETFRVGCSENSAVGPLEKPMILILDDLGAGSLSDSERRFTLELLDRRMNQLKPTVVTSNWSLKSIAEKMDDRIASRLSAYTGFELSGDDLRLPQVT
jgi:DNA replication protein DnaC